MGEDWKSHISKSFNDAVRDYRGWDGTFSDPTELINQKVDLLSNIKTESEDVEKDENQKKDYIDYLKNRNNITKILDLIKNKKLSNNKIKTEIKKLLKNPEDINNFLQAVLDKRFSKKETKEVTSSASSGSYETLFGDMKESICPICGMKNCKCKDKKHKDRTVKKTETKESTSTASSGSYETPKAWAKSLSKKDWGGRQKTQIPGGKFVQVKKKCKRFPYCNQGDIKALNIFENQTLKNTIKKVSEKYDIHEDIIKDIIVTEMNKSY